MLLSLHVKNLALIDETEVNFDDGFNVLSGETGAGKSLIIGSINLALGDRAGKELIRNGAEYALVELIFAVTKPEQERVLKHLEIPYEEGTVFIQRKILPNRSINKVCGETVTVNLLREVASAFIDIHGQHEHQSLLYKKKHLIVVDEFCKETCS